MIKQIIYVNYLLVVGLWLKMFSPYSFGLSATSQQYFSLTTNQPPATRQHYFSLRTNQHQPPAKRTCPLSVSTCTFAVLTHSMYYSTI
jgi:hypothetical protein